jgi:hypothetical protein
MEMSVLISTHHASSNLINLFRNKCVRLAHCRTDLIFG